MSLARITSYSSTLKLTTEAFVPIYCNFNSVRWGTKPRWLPMAPSKAFKIRKRPEAPPGETEEIKRLMNNYRTIIKSLNKYFEEKYSVANQVQFDVEQYKQAVNDDFVRCNIINDQWNLEQKILREQRVQRELDVLLEQAHQNLETNFKLDIERVEEAEEIVRREKIAALDFITSDKLDAAIEYAINNPVDYNFALDLDGNKIWGRETQPSSKTEDPKTVEIKQ